MNENVMVKQYTPLVKYVLSWYKDRDSRIVDELNSEGLIGLLKAIRTHDESKGKFETFAITCIKNAMIDHLRKEDRWAKELIGFNEIGEEVASPLPNQVELYDRYEMNQEIREACGTINDRENFVLTFRMLSEDPMGLEEIAQIYDVSEASIRRDEARLKSRIKENYDYGDGNVSDM
jgi:RNA polymerase sigma factor (sigma-70 family)